MAAELLKVIAEQDAVYGAVWDVKAVLDAQARKLDEVLARHAEAGKAARELAARLERGAARKAANGAAVLLLAGLVFVGPGPTHPEGIAMGKTQTETAATKRAPYKPLPPTDLSAAIAAHRRKDFAAAEKLYASALDAGADRVFAVTSRAECLFYLKRDADTLAACQTLLSPTSPLFAPDCGRAHYLTGLVLERQGQQAEAETAFREAARCGDRIAALRLSK